MNILKADLFYLIKDKTFRILIAIAAIFPIISCLVGYKLSGASGVDARTIIFQVSGADIMCALIGIGLASYFGHDFANNTIRNKVCYGESRTKLTIMSFIESFLISIVLILISLIVSVIAAAILGTVDLSGDFWIKYICQIAIIVAFSFVITAITLCTKNSKPGIFVTVIMTIFVAAAAQMLPMFAAISKVVRVICQCLYMTVSTMMLKCVDGSYQAMEGVTYDNLYANALVLAVVYMAVSVIITIFIARKQSYK